MICDLTRLPDAKPSPFTTTVGGTGQDRDRLLRLVGSVYNDPSGLTDFFHGRGVAEIIGVLDDNGQLISSASVVTAGQTANIWSVATDEAARGRGAAGAAVTAALHHAARSGRRWASLGTSDELVPWYNKHGFVVVGRERSCSWASGRT